MNQYLRNLRETMRKGDVVLLLLCLVTTAFGCLVIASATNTMGSVRYANELYEAGEI